MKSGLKIGFFWITVAALQLAAAQAASTATVGSVLSDSLSAQTKMQVQDVVLTGLVTSGPEGNRETDPFTFKATASGGSRDEIDFSEGPLITIRNRAANGPVGSWSRNGGPSHNMAGHNMLTDAAWYFPVLIVQRLLTDKTATVSYLGMENGFVHLQADRPVPVNTPKNAVALVEHLTQLDLYLDPANMLPARLSFNIHPDNNALVDIPVEVRFSNYQQANGVLVPMREQKYVNGTLALDFEVQSATINSGLTPSTFQF